MQDDGLLDKRLPQLGVKPNLHFLGRQDLQCHGKQVKQFHGNQVKAGMKKRAHCTAHGAHCTVPPRVP